AITDYGISGTTLMENAGRRIVETMERVLNPLTGRRVLVICGRGNNGGDGFVTARLLSEHGVPVSCVLIGELASLTGDARAAADRLQNAGVSIREASTEEEIRQLVRTHNVIVDAIFGTGLNSAPRGLAAAAITAINTSRAVVIAADIPSGVDSDTGTACEPAVRAHHTVTMGLAKLGLWLYPGRVLSGQVHVAEIGFPAELIDSAGNAFLIEKSDIPSFLPPRPPDGHKGTFGTALIVAGSGSFSGAACLCALACVRAGAGLTRLAIPRSLGPEVTAAALEPVKLLLPETEERTLSSAALPEILAASEAADAVAIGPGLTVQPEVRSLTIQLIPRLNKPLVIDADAINALATAPDLLNRLPQRAVITPHPGEMARLLGISAAEVNRLRVDIARRFAAEHRCVVVLKGAATVIASPDNRVFVNPTGNNGLGSGGTGDVLTGFITGLLAQGSPELNAAIAATFLHGLAADLGATELTQYCLTASDLLGYLPRAFSSVIETT
ncbi:MAG: NAD(P)H-hydrate dehydratase, partial [candidate division WOR-3 bacterium]